MHEALEVNRSVPLVKLDELSEELVARFQIEANTFFGSDLAEQWNDHQLTSFLFAGLSTESGEVIDIYKKHELVRGEITSAERLHLLEELGDVCWHVATICTRYGLTMTDVLKANMEKFRTRWPSRFTEVRE